MIAEFDDPRLVAIYDAVNAYGDSEQPDFYADVAAGIGATAVVELGCGTGMVTRHLARRGLRVTGVDPSPTMLEVARRNSPADTAIEWICGDADALGSRDADLAFMSGHVAQFFLTDESWRGALRGLHAALRPGGTLAFESRNPEAREWELWAPRGRRFAVDATAGRIETWSECHELRDGVVTYTNHYVFAATGEELTSTAALRFRSHRELAETLANAGFTIEHVYGDWDRTPVRPVSPELIVVARRD